MVETHDGGPESERVYDANVVDELRNPANKGHEEAIMKNVALMKQWAKEGK